MSAFNTTAGTPTAIIGFGQAPTIPLNLAGVALSQVRISLTWDVSTSNGSGVGGYRVYRDGILVGTTVTNSFIDTGLTPGTSYDYEVSGLDTSTPPLESAKSSPVVPISTLAANAGVVYLDSNAGTVWPVTTAKAVNDIVNAIDTTLLLSFECTIAGTTAASEPTWPTVPGNTVVDGTVTWTARDAISWEYAMITAERAINVYRSKLPIKNVIWGELLHFEDSTLANLIINSANAQADSIPTIRRVDKTTNKYSPSRTDGTINVNFGTINNSSFDVQLTTFSSWFGFRFESADDLKLEDEGYYFEDCVLIFGTYNSNTFLQAASSYINCKNTLIQANNFTNNYFSLFRNCSALFDGCEIKLNTQASGFLQGLGYVSNDYDIHFNSCNLSTLNNPLLVDTSDFSNGSSSFTDFNSVKLTLSNSRLPANYTLWDTVWVIKSDTFINVENCSDDGVNTYVNEKRSLAGSYKHNIVTYRDTGYQDYESSTRFSLQLDTESLASTSLVVESEEIGGFFTSTGGKVVKLQLLENFTFPLNASDIWLELYHLKNSADIARTLDKSTREYIKATFTVLPAGSGLGNWTGEPVGSRSVELVANITVGRTGSFYGVVKLAKYEVGKQVFIDQEFEIT